MKKLLLIILLAVSVSCSDTRDYTVKFDNARLKENDPVLVKGYKVGNVKKLAIDKEYKILVTVSIKDTVKITQGSKFIIQSDLIGNHHIALNLSTQGELINPEEIQIGHLQKFDTTSRRKLSKQEYDSLLKHDANFKLADSIMKMVKVVGDNLEKNKKQK